MNKIYLCPAQRRVRFLVLFTRVLVLFTCAAVIALAIWSLHRSNITDEQMVNTPSGRYVR